MRSRIQSVNPRKQIATVDGGPSQAHFHSSQLPGVPFDFSLVGRLCEFDLAAHGQAVNVALIDEPAIEVKEQAK